MISSSAALALAVIGGLVLAGRGRGSGERPLGYDPNQQDAFINNYPDRLRPVQTALVALGYDAPENGLYDTRTVQAVGRYWDDRGIPYEYGITPAMEYQILQEALPYLSGSGAAEYYYGSGSGSTPSTPISVGGSGSGSGGGASVDLDPLGGAIVRNGSTIATLQSQLYQLGYNPGRTDGTADGATLAALNQFLRDDGALAAGAQGYTSITDAMVRLVASAWSGGRLASDPRAVSAIEPTRARSSAAASRAARVASVVRQARAQQQLARSGVGRRY